MVKNLPAIQEIWVSSLGPDPGLGVSPGGGNGNSLQYSCLENPMDRKAWQDYTPWLTKELHTTSVQCNSVTQSCPTLCDPWTASQQDSLSITNSQSLLKLMLIESVMPSNHLILCHPLLLLP